MVPAADENEDDDWVEDDGDEDDGDDDSDAAADDEITCAECGAAIYDDSPCCPRCGTYQPADTNPLRGRPWWWLALGLAGVLAVALGALLL